MQMFVFPASLSMTGLKRYRRVLYPVYNWFVHVSGGEGIMPVKKFFALFVLLVLSAGLMWAGTGVWEKRYYVDDFDDYTDVPYLRTSTQTGSFSNSAVTDSYLAWYLIIDRDSASIVLYENVTDRVKGTEDDTYTVTVRDDNGKDTVYNAFLNWDRLEITGNSRFVSILKNNKNPRIVIKENSSYGYPAKYKLGKVDTTGFAELYKDTFEKETVAVHKLDEGEYALGMGVIYSDNHTDEQAAYDCVVAVVVTDEEGRIVECRIDDAQNKMNTDAIDSGKTFRSKKELEYDYNMVKYSEAVNEWFQQAAAFEDYCVGKTAEEVASLPTRVRTESEPHPGYVVTTDETLFASCSIQITSFKKVISEAAENAQ